MLTLHVTPMLSDPSRKIRPSTCGSGVGVGGTVGVGAVLGLGVAVTTTVRRTGVVVTITTWGVLGKPQEAKSSIDNSVTAETFLTTVLLPGNLTYMQPARLQIKRVSSSGCWAATILICERVRVD